MRRKNGRICSFSRAALTVPHMLLDAVMRYRQATKEI